MKKLSELAVGESAVIQGFDDGCNIRRRLQDMGMVKGTPVSCVAQSPLGEPKAYLVRSTLVALRKKDCEKIICDANEFIMQEKR